MGKYSKNVYEFEPAAGCAPQVQAADIPAFGFGGGSCVEGAEFVSGYYVLDKAGEVEKESHVHAADEYLMFGSVSLRRSDWDAELELVMGEGDKAELIKISEPATIRIPAGLAHGPLRVVRAAKPVVFQPALLAEKYEAKTLEAAAAPGAETSRYSQLIFKNMKEKKGNYVDGSKIVESADDIVGIGFRGACQIVGATVNLGGSIIDAPLFIDPYPHTHPTDELLAFMGSPEAPFDFDAEVRFTLGNGEDAEEFVITKPTIVFIPKGSWHCPLNFVRIGKPVFFQVNMLSGAFGGTYMLPDGIRDMYFNGLIKCIVNPDKDCDCCHKCLQMEWKEA